MSLTTEQISAINAAISAECGIPMYGVVKRGLWYRPNDCGYTDNPSEAGRYTFDQAKAREYLLGDEPATVKVLPPPNYYGDLNACSQMVDAWKPHQHERTEFCVHLRRIVVRDCAGKGLESPDGGLLDDAWFYNATAPQRCEAFFCVQKWEWPL